MNSLSDIRNIIFTLSIYFFAEVLNASAQTDTLYLNLQNIHNQRTPHELRNGFTSCVQDKKGFIWFGSRNGLFRFDGINYKSFNYKSGDSTTIGGQWVQGLKVDLNGNLWIGGDGWLSRMDSHTGIIKTWHHEWVDADGHKSSWNEHFLCDNKNADVIWFPINSVKSLIGKFEVSKNLFSLIDLPSTERGLRNYPSRFLELVQDSSGVLYQGRIGTMAVYNPETGKQQIYYAVDKNRHFDFLLPRQNGAICLNYDSLYLVSNDSFAVTANNPPSSLFKWTFGYCADFNTNQILFTDYNLGLRLFDKNTKRFSLVTSNDLSVRQNFRNIDCRIYLDNDGRYWISAGGIFILDKKLNRVNNLQKLNNNIQLLINTKRTSMFENFARSFYYLPGDSTIYFIDSDGSNLFYSNINSGKIESYKLPLSVNKPDVSGITDDMQHHQLIFTYDLNLCFWNYATYTFESIPLKLDPSFLSGRNPQFVSILIDSLHHCYWIGEYWKGIVKYDYKGKQIITYPFPKVFPIDDVIKPKAVSGDYVYFISRKGLCCYHYSTGKFERINIIQDDVSQNSVSGFTDLVLDTDNTIWLSSTNGLFHYNPLTKATKQYSSSDGMAVNEISQLFKVSKNRFLIRNDYGVFVYDVKNKGSLEVDFNLGVPLYSMEMSPDGNLTFERGLKFWQCNLNDYLQPTKEFPLLITAVKEHNQEILLENYADELSSIDLNYRQDFLTISFAALDYSYASRIEYECNFGGDNNHWINTKGNTEFSVGNLRPGKYKFMVRAKSIDGIWRELENPLTIIIHPPFWNTWWFYLLIAFTFFAIVYAIVRIYVQRKMLKQKMEFEKQEVLLKERNRISAELHDDLGAGLTSIALLSELTKRTKIKEDEMKNLDKISDSANELVDKMSEIIWSMNPKNDSLGNLISYVREYTGEYLEPFSIDVEFEICLSIPDKSIDGNHRRNVFLVVKETLHNIVKHASATKVLLIVKLIDDKILIRIEDNGKGFIPLSFGEGQGVRSAGNGLINMQKRMHEIGGTYFFKSEHGSITTTEIEFKI